MNSRTYGDHIDDINNPPGNISRRRRAQLEHQRHERDAEKERRKRMEAKLWNADCALAEKENAEALAGTRCQWCGKECHRKGLASHERACRMNPKNMALYRT